MNTLDGGVGMQVHKSQIDLPTGESIRMCIWDPKMTMLPKEQTYERVKRIVEQKKAKV